MTDLKRTAVPPEADLANELLAEAQLSLFRRLPRLAVLNSFTAVETLANSVFKQVRTASSRDSAYRRRTQIRLPNLNVGRIELTRSTS